MVKAFIIMVVSFTLLSGSNSCIECHAKKKISLRKTFMKALLVYGGEQNFKTALFYYCKKPAKSSSVMEEEFIQKHLPLKPVALSDELLKKLIDWYWKSYKIEGNLK